MKIVNLTPHEVRVYCPVIDEMSNGEQVNYGDNVVVFPSEGVARLGVKTDVVDWIDGITITKQAFGTPEGLPEEELDGDGTPVRFYIVSQVMASALPERCDLLYPADLVRDEEGKVIGCKSLGI